MSLLFIPHLIVRIYNKQNNFAQWVGMSTQYTAKLSNSILWYIVTQEECKNTFYVWHHLQTILTISLEWA